MQTLQEQARAKFSRALVFSFRSGVLALTLVALAAEALPEFEAKIVVVPALLGSIAVQGWAFRSLRRWLKR